MPEGDVVWRAARQLHAALAGRVLTRSDFRVPRFAAADLTGSTVTAAVSRGKHLLIRTDDGQTVHSHLRMDGSWRIWPGRPPPADHRVRLVLGNDDWLAVGYLLAMVEVLPSKNEHAVVGHLGPDLLGPDWDSAEAVRRLRRRPDRPIGEALLDQRNLAGIGNVYKCEVLFLRGLSPWRPAGQVDDAEALVKLARTAAGREQGPDRAYHHRQRPARRAELGLRPPRPAVPALRHARSAAPATPRSARTRRNVSPSGAPAASRTPPGDQAGPRPVTGPARDSAAARARRHRSMPTNTDRAPGASSEATEQLVSDLFRAHALGLIRVAVLLVGDQPSAEDVVQDAFIGLYRALPRIRDQAKALPYLRTSVINGARSVLRARKRAALRRIPHEPPVWSAESAAMAGEDRRAVLTAVARLPRRAREVLALRYYLDLPDHEIAAALGVSRGTVSSTASRALTALARDLREEQ